MLSKLRKLWAKFWLWWVHTSAADSPFERVFSHTLERHRFVTEHARSSSIPYAWFEACQDEAGNAVGTLTLSDSERKPLLLVEESLSEVVRIAGELIGVDIAAQIDIETDRSGCRYCGWEGQMSKSHI